MEPRVSPRQLLHPSDLGDYFDIRRSSEVSTAPRQLAGTNTAIVSGQQIGTLAIARSSGAYTQIRICTGTTVTAVTSLKVCVWAAAGTLIQASADQSATVTTGSTLYTLPLGGTVNVVAGTSYYLGVAFTGTTLNIFGSPTNVLAVAALSPALVASASGYAGGTPDTLVAGGISKLPWAELVA